MVSGFSGIPFDKFEGFGERPVRTTSHQLLTWLCSGRRERIEHTLYKTKSCSMASDLGNQIFDPGIQG